MFLDKRDIFGTGCHYAIVKRSVKHRGSRALARQGRHRRHGSPAAVPPAAHEPYGWKHRSAGEHWSDLLARGTVAHSYGDTLRTAVNWLKSHRC